MWSKFLKSILQYSRYVYMSKKILKRFIFTKCWFNLTFLFSLSLAASLGWLKRNILVLPSNITAPVRKTTEHSLTTSYTWKCHIIFLDTRHASKNKMKIHFDSSSVQWRIVMATLTVVHSLFLPLPTSQKTTNLCEHTCSHTQSCSRSSGKE